MVDRGQDTGIRNTEKPLTDDLKLSGTYTIERGYVVSGTRIGKYDKVRRSVASLIEGDSFFVPRSDFADVDPSSWTGNVYGIAKSLGLRVSIEKWNQGGTDGWRVHYRSVIE